MDLEREEENQRLVTEKKIRKKMKDTIFFLLGTLKPYTNDSPY